MKFTSSQLRAIRHTNGNLQLIACAGSGKTEVVARRVVELLQHGCERGIAPANIVAFTFADKAAAELKERIVSRCREELGQIPGLAEMFVGTIHAFCLDILISEVPEFMKYEVLNEVQQVILVDRESRKSGLTASTDLNGRRLCRYVDTKYYVAALSILRETDLLPGKLKGCTVLKGLEDYRELLTSKRYLDYSAIMEQAERAMGTDFRLQARLAERIKHVIVDEYQDVNPVQERILHHLHRFGAELCVVGDDDQTIYQWRGTNVGNILTFEERYPDVTQIKLQENFRSSKGIIETARRFIQQNQDRLEKAMEETGAQSFDEGDLVACSFDDPENEAVFIVKTIRELLGVEFTEGGTTRGLSYSDCAILLRSVRTNGRPIISALRHAKIPFIVTGMNNLFESPEAEASRQLFYFLASRNDVDLASLKRSWHNADLGIDGNRLDRAVAAAEDARRSIDRNDDKRFGVYSLQRSFMTFLEDLELREYKVPNDGTSKERGEVIFYNLGKFSQLITDFETIHYHSEPKQKYSEFASFLEYHAEEAYPEGWQDNQYANPDAVRVMTVHQAKGKEWPVVFLPAMLRNRFPSKRMGGRNVWHLIPREGVAEQDRFEGSVEDERRLFYVAMTRSQKFLFMTWAPIKGNQLFQRPSEFWEDVLASKSVKRRQFDYSRRKHVDPHPKKGISNVVFSFSDIKYFFECPYQFKLRILYGFNAPIHEALGYGKSLHNALADIHKKALQGAITPKSDIDNLVSTHLHVPYAFPELRANLEGSAKRVLDRYLDDNEALLTKIEFAEKTVEINLDSGVAVRGRIDLVRRLDTNETTIVDLKCSERTQPEEVTETQLHIYALGYRELTGRDADFVEVYELDEGRRKPRSIDDAFIEDVKGQVWNAAQALREGRLGASAASTRCKNCDFHHLCSEGEKYREEFH